MDLWGQLWRRTKEKKDIRKILHGVKKPEEHTALREEDDRPVIREVPRTRDTEILLGRIGDSRAFGSIAHCVQRTGEGEDL
jgi:hypothetical protein